VRVVGYQNRTGMKSILSLVLVFLFGFVFFSVGWFWKTEGVYSMSNLNVKPIDISSNQLEGFGIILSTNKGTYTIGEPILIKLKIFNRSSKEIIFHFRSSQRFDFSIFKGEKEIWQWSKDKFFAQVLGELILEPDKIIVYEEKFEDELEIGSYQISGELTAEGKPLRATLAITVKED